jgi:cytochrome P450
MTLQFATEHQFTTEVDIGSVAFWSRPFDERDRTFAELRAAAPVSWQPPMEVPGYDQHGEAGYWAVTRAQDITRVSRDSDLFVSRFGVSIAPSPLQIQVLASFFLAMDQPRHTTYRRLVSAAFSPRAVAKITEQIYARATKIVDDIVGAGEIDFVSQCSALLPMQTVCDLIGVPPSEQEGARRAADLFISESDPATVPGNDPIAFRLQQAHYLHELGASLAAHRRETPGEDLITNLVQAEIDGSRLTDEEIGAFMVLMSVAGNDTTKQTTTRTMMSLVAHPEQRDWLLEDFDGRIGDAIEEFLRYASPVMTFARTATQDTELGGMQIAAGDKVGMFYCSGNRDEAAFDEPQKFDLSRPRPAHVAFGGGGVHFCLGAVVARTQLRALFGELLRKVPSMEIGEPDLLLSNFINGVKRLPVHIA